jgi:hypothetical protein
MSGLPNQTAMKTKILLPLLLLIAYNFAGAQNPRWSLVEKGSSTSCDECVCIDSLMQYCVKPAHPRSIVLIYHEYFSGLRCPQCDTLVKYLTPDHSEIRTNRDTQFYKFFNWNSFHLYCDSVLGNLSRVPEDAPVKISIDSKTWDSQTRTVTLATKFQPYQGDLTGTYMVNAVLVEDRVLHEQSMVDSCGGFSGSRPSYHQNVVRTMTYQFGDQLKSGTWLSGESIPRTFSFSLETDYNPDNCNLVVYVYKQAGALYNSAVQQAIIQSVSRPVSIEDMTIRPAEVTGIFPNPAMGTTTAYLRITEEGTAAFSVIDLNGREVLQLGREYVRPGIYYKQFNVENLPQGNFLFRVTLNNQVTQKKMVVIRR